jgi:hypothetical protein
MDVSTPVEVHLVTVYYARPLRKNARFSIVLRDKKQDLPFFLFFLDFKNLFYFSLNAMAKTKYLSINQTYQEVL